MSEMLAQGVQKADVVLRYLNAQDATEKDLRWCDGLIIGSPENFGYMSGIIKDFFDRTFYKVVDEQLNLPYVLFIGAGNDGTGASIEIQRIAKGYPFKLVSEPLICNKELSESDFNQCRELGQAFAEGLNMGIY
jgi:flavorubredoxin